MRIAFVIVACAVLPFIDAAAQSQFVKPTKADQSKFRGEVTYPRAKPIARPATPWNPADPTSWNAGQREAADALWEKEREERLAREAAARDRQTSREPTAWERAYAEEQAQQVKDKEALIRHLEKVRTERKKRQQQALKNAQR